MACVRMETCKMCRACMEHGKANASVKGGKAELQEGHTSELQFLGMN